MPVFALPATKKYSGILLCFGWVFFLTAGLWNTLRAQSHGVPGKYYIHAAGKDSNPGTFEQPWQTLHALTGLQLHPGDHVYLQGGQIFRGSIQWNAKNAGTSQQPIRIGSYGKGRAIIDAGNQTAITLDQCKWIHLENLVLQGSGRKKGNAGRGIWIHGSRNISLEKL
ncbi:MAG TPA: hypothetical protein VK543_15185, partial [Puia sp.]|nr:hypothetical protein [Puia sp.]